jgi:hypothetical protein
MQIKFPILMHLLVTFTVLTKRCEKEERGPHKIFGLMIVATPSTHIMRSLMIWDRNPIKFRRMRWAGYVACVGKREAYTGFWWGTLRERDHLEAPGTDDRIILRWIFRK